MYDTILVPTDGRPGTEGAVVRAIDLARTVDAAVHVLYAVDTRPEWERFDETDREEARDQLRARGKVAIAEIKERAREFDLAIESELREGAPHRAVLEYAREQSIDAIVMGPRGRTGPQDRHLGSTTERVLTEADVPVLTVRLDGEGASVPESPGTMYDRVVIPSDGSDAAERAAEQGLRVAERYGADVRVVYVVDAATYGHEDAPGSIVGLLREGGRNAVEAIAASARERNLPVSTSILRGVPEEALLQYVDGADGDLIAMGSRGRAGVDDQFLGSTTARVVQRSNVPVLAVH